jgi:hypothetical protein
MRSAWSAAVKVTGAGLALAAWLAWGCSDASERSSDGENRDLPGVTDLRSTLMPASRDALQRRGSPGSESSESSGSASEPRADEDDPSCQDTCSSKHYECGKVCGQDCGKCRDGEECRNGKCECNSSCDGTRCSNACGQACECAAGTVCDASGMCMPPDRACIGPSCAQAPAVPELPAPSEPPDPAPVQP